MGLNALSFLGGLGTGALTQWKANKDQERQDKLDAMREQEFAQRTELFNEQREERNQKKAIEKQRAEIMATGETQTGSGVDIAGSGTFYKDPAQAQADADNEAFIQDASISPNVDVGPATGPAGKVTQANAVRTIDGRNKLFTGLNAASDAAKFTRDNPTSSYAKEMAIHDKLSAMPGGAEAAKAAMVRAKEMRQEGVMEAYSLLRQGDLTGAKQAFNRSGAHRLAEDQNFVANQVVDPVTKAAKTVFSVVGADGKVAVPDVDMAIQGYLLGYKDQVTMDRQSKTDAFGNQMKIDELKLKERELQEVKIPNAETQKQLADIRGQLYSLKSAGAEPAAFDPTAGFDLKHAQAAVTTMVDEQIKTEGLKVTPQQRAKLIVSNVDAMRNTWAQSRSQEARASVFLTMARQATTPQQIEQVRAEARARNFTDADMAALDRRFALAPAAKAGTKTKTPSTTGQTLGNLRDLVMRDRSLSGEPPVTPPDWSKVEAKPQPGVLRYR